MSVTTWVVEFYPIDASVFADSGSRYTWADAVKHSLRKWQGALEENLEKHGVLIDIKFEPYPTLKNKDNPKSKDVFVFDETTCALCMYTYRFGHSRECSMCPLYKVRGGVSCDALGLKETTSPYTAMMSFADPRPMIVWLRRALRVARRLEKRNVCEVVDA